MSPYMTHSLTRDEDGVIATRFGTPPPVKKGGVKRSDLGSKNDRFGSKIDVFGSKTTILGPLALDPPRTPSGGPQGAPGQNTPFEQVYAVGTYPRELRGGSRDPLSAGSDAKTAILDPKSSILDVFGPQN